MSSSSPEGFGYEVGERRWFSSEIHRLCRELVYMTLYSVFWDLGF